MSSDKPEKPSEKTQVDVSRLSDFEVSMLIIERDTAQFKINAINELLNKIGEARGFVEAQEKEPQGFVEEETFNILKFEHQEGSKLGSFEVAHKKNNLPDKWTSAFNILKQSSAVISSRYHGPNYEFSYWLYGQDQIYRQKLKGRDAETARVVAPSNIFPKDLADLLSFEETKDWVVIKPRQFLGSENFSKIAAIAKDNKGDYISAGKESHFRLPKTAAK